MDTHETAMKIKYKLITALHSNNTYILREAPRYSGMLFKSATLTDELENFLNIKMLGILAHFQNWFTTF